MQNIDNVITDQLNLIENIASTLEFEEIHTFSLSEMNKENFEKYFKKINYPGIYLFEIQRNSKNDYQSWISDFTLKFRGPENSYLHQFTPNIIEYRKHKHSNNEEWIPLYIGKCKNIKYRIDKHLFSTLGLSPFALKLKSRDNLLEEKFRVKTIKIDVKNYEVIVTHLEKTLRNLLNPIVGKH